MTPPMPTDETPSAGAMARREVLEWDGIEQAAGGSTRMPWEEQRERLIGRMAVALDAFAREREAAVWEEAAKVLDKCSAVIPVSTADESIYAAQLAIKVALTAIGIELRTRAAEKRGTP